MIDHIYLPVADLARSARFYARALQPLGWRDLGAFIPDADTVPALHGFGDDAYGSGDAVGSSLWLRARSAGETGLYVGLVADTNEAVDAAFSAAIDAGGTERIAPGPRPHFGPGYYAANVLDVDYNQLEFVRKSFNPSRNRASR